MENLEKLYLAGCLSKGRSMSETIGIELMFFLVSIKGGIILLLAYDVLRIIRRIIAHNRFFVAVEDVLFWIVTSIYIFGIMYQQNDGIIRGFSILGMGLGMVFYYHLFSKHVVHISTTLLRRIIILIQNIIKGITYPFRSLARIVRSIIRKPSKAFLGLFKKVYRKLVKGLKKMIRTVKISVSKK